MNPQSLLWLFYVINLSCGLHIEIVQLEGEICTTSNGSAGICSLAIHCRSAETSIHLESFEICGPVGGRKLICCPSTMDEMTVADLPTGAKSKIACEWYDYVRPHFSFLIFGDEVSIQQFPHMVKIGYGSEDNITWACAGSFITMKFILTAAHCLYDTNLGNATFVEAGSNETSEIEDLIRHPKYVDKYHDIGLIKVKEHFKISEYTQPACLFAERYFPDKDAIVTGWGKNEHGPYSKELLQARLEIIQAKQCNETYKSSIPVSLRMGIVDDLMICAGSSKDTANTCEGDSGSPLQFKISSGSISYIVGVTSFGKSFCGVLPNSPGVYTRVSGYMKWIEENVWPSPKNDGNKHLKANHVNGVTINNINSITIDVGK